MSHVLAEIGQRWRAHATSQRMALDTLVREALTDNAVERLFHERASLISTTEADIAWAAGLFEGEGCWTVHRGKQAALKATLVTTDRDVLIRFCRVVGRGSVSDRPEVDGHPDHRPTWRWAASNASVIEIALMFWPYLGERRRRVFCEKLAEREKFIQTATVARPCEGCGEDFRPRYSRMASRTRFCSDVCRQRAQRTRERA